ncbi:hypothetical protein TNCV_2902861 [Trichonephila clavipes]|nr:hypothetical protein TNCV_2902861 [Trichonephila clavipes]
MLSIEIGEKRSRNIVKGKVLKAVDNNRRKTSPCRYEFREPRSDTLDIMTLERHFSNCMVGSLMGRDNPTLGTRAYGKQKII